MRGIVGVVFVVDVNLDLVSDKSKESSHGLPAGSFDLRRTREKDDRISRDD